MIPLRIRVNGFGPHIDTTIDWRKVASVTALVAPNGSGKTFILEAPFACLYGHFPSRPGSLGDHLTQGGPGCGVIEMDFEHNGKMFFASRILKSSRTTCVLADHTGTAIAGPNVRDFEAAIAARFGDEKTALATWMASQGGAGDLTVAPASERREVFGKILGFEKLDAIADTFRDAAIQSEAEASTLEKQLMDVLDFDAAIAREQQVLARENARAQQCDADIQVVTETLEATRGRIRDASGGEDVLRGQIKTHEDAVVAEQGIALQVNDLKGEITQLVATAAGKSKAIEAKDRIDQIDAQLDRLREQAKAYSFFLEMDQKDKEIVAREKVHGATIRELKNHPGCDEATKALAGKLESLRKEHTEAKAENERIALDNSRLQVRREDLKGRIATLNTKISGGQMRLNTKPETPFGEKCSPCQFLAEYVGIPKQIEEWSAELAKNKGDLAAIPEDAPPKNLEEIVRRGQEARTASETVAKAEATTTRLNQEIALLAEVQKSLEAHRAIHLPYVENPEQQRNSLIDEANKLRPVANALPSCEQAEEFLVTRRARLDALDEQLIAAKRRVADTQVASDSARRALDEREVRLRELKDEERRRIDALAIANKDRDSAISSIAGAKARIVQNEKEKALVAQKQSAARIIRARAARQRLLQQAFGKKGIQPILIDQAAPQLESLADALLEQLTSGKMRLRFSTRRALKSGGVSEDFLILAQDQRGERDVNTFSGGEQRLLQTVLRLAMMMWIGRIHGRPTETLCIDEGFDALDPENADNMVQLLRSLGNRFSRVVVISHEDEIASKLPGCVRLNRHALGVDATYN